MFPRSMRPCGQDPRACVVFLQIHCVVQALLLDQWTLLLAAAKRCCLMSCLCPLNIKLCALPRIVVLPC